ncbi:MAG: DUF1893 domain-containing protein [Dehalococcoidia bacterium]
MRPSWIEEFLKSTDTLRVYKGTRLIFSSRKDRLAPLIDFLKDFNPEWEEACFLDRVVGNAAALLLVKAGCSDVYSEIGSELAARTLNDAGIKFEFKLTVPFIINQCGDDMCPMEKLSLCKTPEAFWEELQSCR